MSKLLPKPQMRNMYQKKIKFHLAGAAITSLTAGLLMKIFYCDRRKQIYEDFYKNYDAEKQWQIMVDADLLQCVQQIREAEEEKKQKN